MTWRELAAKLVWGAGLIGYPLLLLRGFGLPLGWGLLGGLALAFVTPPLFLLVLAGVDRLRQRK